jgi:hypothetical protein
MTMWSRVLISLLPVWPIFAADFVNKFDAVGVPPEGEFFVTRAHLDFGRLIDERSLRLFQVDGKERRELPYQFSASAQPRPRVRPLATGTPNTVSYAAEYMASEAPTNLITRGELTWIISRSSAALYVLEFSTPEKGRIVQTPFPPQNFRMFDEGGRGTPVRWFSSMQLHPQWPVDGVVHFYDGTDLITSYRIGPSLQETNPAIRRPFFFPVNGPDGIGLTEFGKPHDPTGSHAHHYSLWITHHDVDGVSFWGERAGVIAHESLDEMEDGPIFSKLVQTARWRKDEREYLRERRTITLYKSAGDFRLMDIEIALTPAGSNAVTFGKTSFGFLAARVAQSMTVFDGAGEIRTAAGKLNESGAHLTRAAWLDQSGPIAQDKWGGIAILDSPDNPNFPTGWHCRNDGWAGAAFNMDAPFTLEADKTLRLCYRIILHRGDAAKANIARRFEEWSARPEIKIGKIEKRK